MRGKEGTADGRSEGPLIDVVNPLEEAVDVSGAMTDDGRPFCSVNWDPDKYCNLEA